MDELATEIAGILHDYHRYNGFNFNSEHVLKWVSQFDADDRQFILEEFLHLIKQDIYISEDKGRELLIESIQSLAQYYKFKSPADFLKNAEILSLQDEQKSQGVLIGMLGEEINKLYGITLKDCGTVSKKYALYIDDVLASGNTVYNDVVDWLNLEGNFDKVVKKERILIVSVFCLHNWQMIDFRLKLNYDTDDILKKIRYWYNYEIQNHRGFPDQKFNFGFPISSEMAIEYFNTLEATQKADKAFRNIEQPKKELFFSNSENRIRFENIILKKGIELLKKAKVLHKNHRPMGITTPSHKTLGTGTLFFTWRNVSNTTPIVFWWGTGDWYPLFELINRGN